MVLLCKQRCSQTENKTHKKKIGKVDNRKHIYSTKERAAAWEKRRHGHPSSFSQPTNKWRETTHTGRRKSPRSPKKGINRFTKKKCTMPISTILHAHTARSTPPGSLNPHCKGTCRLSNRAHMRSQNHKQTILWRLHDTSSGDKAAKKKNHRLWRWPHGDEALLPRHPHGGRPLRRRRKTRTRQMALVPLVLSHHKDAAGKHTHTHVQNKGNSSERSHCLRRGVIVNKTSNRMQ